MPVIFRLRAGLHTGAHVGSATVSRRSAGVSHRMLVRIDAACGAFVAYANGDLASRRAHERLLHRL